MTIKEVFEKAANESHSLTYEEFAKLAGSAKFADLSEGNYVGKQKHLDELASKDMAISTLNESIQSRDADVAKLHEQLKSADADAEKLAKLSASMDELQAKYDTDTAALQDKLSAQAYEFAVRDFAAKQKFSSVAARRDFEGQLLRKSLPMEDGGILGADDFMKVYAKENADAFIKDAPPAPANKPKFVSSTRGNNEGAKMTLTEMMVAKNENPNFVVSFD